MPNNHLVFGTAWHKAMEYIRLHGYNDISVLNAFDAFLKEYRKEFAEDTDEIYTPKTPAIALKALGKYVDQYRSDEDDYEVLFTEIAITVPIAEDVVLHCRMDTIVEDRKEKRKGSLDFKTKKNAVNRQWRDQWLLSPQMGTYNHVLYCLYPYEEVFGLRIDGVFFFKTKVEFERVPVYRDRMSMRVWHWNMADWVYDLLDDYNKLSECSDEDEVLGCFHMNTGNCTKYFGCAYHDFCYAWPNPIQQSGEPPLGFKVEWWDPRKMESTHKMEL